MSNKKDKAESQSRERRPGENGVHLRQGGQGTLLARWHLNGNPVKRSRPCCGWAQSDPETSRRRGPGVGARSVVTRKRVEARDTGSQQVGQGRKARVRVVSWGHRTWDLVVFRTPVPGSRVARKAPFSLGAGLLL